MLADGKVLFLAAYALLTTASLADSQWDNRQPGYKVSSLPLMHRLDETAFVEQLAKALELTADNHLIRDTETASVIGKDRIVRYRQQYRGIEVLDAGLTLRLRDARVFSYQSHIADRLDLDTTPAIAAARARAVAEDHFAGLAGRRGAVAEIDMAHSGCTLAVRTSHTGTGSTGRLVHRCQLVSPAAAYTIEVDDISGRVSHTAPLRQELWQPASVTGQTVHHGLVGPFAAEVDENGTYRLQTTTHKTFDLKGGGANGQYDGAVNFTDTTLPVDGANAPGVSVHWAIERALSHYQQRFGADPQGGLNAVIYAYVDVDMSGAQFDPLTGSIAYGNQGTDWVAFDVSGHEVAHRLAAIEGPTGDHVGEYGALHESFADVLAQLAEESALGMSDWILAAELAPGTGKQRNLLDPTQSAVNYNNGPITPQPDAYQIGPYWITPTPPFDKTNDWGGVHINSSIPNLWFTLLAFGGNGTNSANVSYDVKGVGTYTAANILYAYMMESLLPGTGFFQARQVSEDAASALCGEMSQARVSAANAWHAVGVGQGPVTTLPYASPYPGQVDVMPWPVRLTWQAQVSVPETSWEVQISTDPTFPSGDATQTAPTTTTATENNMPVGVIESFILQPSTPYYWRVRPTNTDTEANCWRPVMSFTTASMVPLAGSPNNTLAHPWHLPFQFTGEAKYFELEVHWRSSKEERMPSCENPVFSGPKTLCRGKGDGDETCTIEGEDVDLVDEVTVPVQSTLAWRVRAKPTLENTSIHSDWSACLGFETDLPQPVLIAPTNTYEYPWPVTFSWEELPGAEMDLTIKSQGLLPDDGFTSEHPFETTLKDVEGTSAEQNLEATFYVDNIAYDWQLHNVLGPPWGTKREPEPDNTREAGKDSAVYTFLVNGNTTFVDAVSPDWSNVSPGCKTVGSDIKFSFLPVPQAHSYEIFVYPRECPLTQPSTPCTNRPNPVDSFPVPAPCIVGADPNCNPTEPVTIVRSGVSGPFPVAPLGPDQDLVGYAWGVRAYSGPEPGGVQPGVPIGSFDYYLKPTKPVLSIPIDSAEIATGSHNVVFGWQSSHAHGGGFVYQVYDDANCNHIDWGTEVKGFSNGVTQISVNADWGGEKEVAHYSWRVRPFDYDFCPGAGPWSDCFTFQTEPPPEPPPKEGAQTISCGQTVSGFNEGLTDYVVEFGGPATGNIRVLYNHYCVPDRTYIRSPQLSQIYTTDCTGTANAGQYDVGNNFNCSQPAFAEGDWVSISDMSYVYLNVQPMCIGTNDTAWEVVLECDLNVE